MTRVLSSIICLYLFAIFFCLTLSLSLHISSSLSFFVVVDFRKQWLASISVENGTRSKKKISLELIIIMNFLCTRKGSERRKRRIKDYVPFSIQYFIITLYTEREIPPENYLFWQKLKLHVLMNLCGVPAYTQNTFIKKSHKAITANFLFIFSLFILYSHLFHIKNTHTEKKHYKARNQTFFGEVRKI